MNFKAFSFLEHPRMFFFFGVFIFFLGIITGSYDSWWVIFLNIFIIFGFLYASFERLFIKFLFFLGIFLIGWNFSQTAENHRYATLETLNAITNDFSEKVTITGKITRKMFQWDQRETYRLNIDTIDTTSTHYIIDPEDKIGIFVDIPKNLTLNIGDIISFSGKLKPLIEFENDEIAGFSRYAWFHESYAKFSLYTFERKFQAEQTFFDTIQQKVKNIIFNGFPEKTAALLLGITIGNTDMMTSEMKWEFKNASLTHILVVSGSNITFIIMILGFFLKYIPIRRIMKYILIFGFLGLYGSLIGWDIPVIRATVMGIIIYFGITNGWKINSIALLFGIAVVLSFFSPLSLLYDASFGLSFGATIGIILLNQPIHDFLQKFFKFSWISTLMSVTLAATMGSLGSMIYFFGSISILGIFANILIAGFMSILLFLATIYIVMSFMLPDIILYFIGLPVYFLGEIIFVVSGFFGKFSLVEIPEQTKIPLSIILYFMGFLYLLHTQEQKILMYQTNHQN